MKWDRVSRRFFLQGLGGVTLALPVLPSLLDEAAAATAPPLRFIGVWSPNGQRQDIFYPSVAASRTLAPNVRDLPLASIQGPISKVLGTAFDPLRSKLTLIRGLDLLPQYGHNLATMLGACSSGSDSVPVPNETLDQVLAKSAKIYASQPGLRSLQLKPDNYFSGRSVSFGKVGTRITPLPAVGDAKAALRKVFPLQGLSDADKAKQLGRERKVTDAVFNDFKRALASPRLGSEDKSRLEGHVAFINDLENRINVVESQSTCPASNIDGSAWTTAYNDATASNFIDVLVAAIKCGVTRVGTVIFSFTPTVTPNSFHGNSHDSGPTGEAISLDANAWIAGRVAELLKKLDVVEDPATGRTYLDNSIVYWGNEISEGRSHLQHGMPVLLAGSAGGQLETGRYIDYRNTQGVYRTYSEYPVGRPYNELLVTILQAMGLSPADYETPGTPGFGQYGAAKDQSKYVLGDRRSPLPFLRKA